MSAESQNAHESAIAGEGSVGQRLRVLRMARGLHLKQVAAETGVSVSFLSMLENDQTDITLGRLMRLVSFYRISIADLVGGDTTIEQVLVRGDKAKKIHSPCEGVDFFLLAPNVARDMSACLIVYQPGTAMLEYDQHPGEEWTFVLEGEVELRREGLEPVVMGAGDSAYYPGSSPHVYVNVGQGVAKVIGVVTPARF